MLQILLIVFGIILIASTLLQNSKSTGLSSSIMGGTEQLFQNRKTNGKQKILSMVTIITAVAMLALTVWGMLS